MQALQEFAALSAVLLKQGQQWQFAAKDLLKLRQVAFAQRQQVGAAEHGIHLRALLQQAPQGIAATAQ